jgi:glycosyl transferase family 87
MVLALDWVLRRLCELLDRRRLAVDCAVLLVVEIAVAAFFVAGTHGLITPPEQPLSTDFVSFYAAGKLADAGTPALVYDQAAHHAAEQAATQPGIPYIFFFYPPVFLLLCAALALLPYLAAFFVFEAVTLALYLFVATTILRERRWAILPLLAFPPLLWNFSWGQNAFLTAALFGGATLLVERRPIIAGFLFGALCYKPHFGLLIPIALAAGGHWRAFAGAAASFIALTLSSLLLFGANTWQQFLLAATASHATYESGQVSLGAFVTPFGAVMLLDGAPATAYAVQAIALLAGAAAVGWVWHRGLSLAVRAATLCAATLLAIPVALFYDLMLATVAVCWLYRSKGGILPEWRVALAGLFAACLYPVSLFDSLRLPVGPVVALAVACAVAAHVRREMARPRTEPSIAIA